MLEYLEQIPSGALSPFIDKFWYCKAQDLSQTTLVLPFLHHELVFNFSETYQLSHRPSGPAFTKNLTSWVSGVQTRPVVHSSAGKHEMMGVLFKPMGLKAFVPYSSKEFENEFVDGSQVFGTSFAELVDKLQHELTPNEKLTLVADYLKTQFEQPKQPAYLMESLQMMNADVDSRMELKKISDDLGVSHKSLIKAYHKHIGITPAKYLQILSLHKATSKLTQTPKQSLTELAYDLHFFDQSHFIKLFKTFTGLTPKEYSRFASSGKVEAQSPQFLTVT